MKQIIRINASSLKESTCMLRWHRTIIQGYKQPKQSAAVMYGVAVHAFINAMFKTDGRLDLARKAALHEFRKPKYEDLKSRHLNDELHLIPTCLNLWEDSISTDQHFQILQMTSSCWWCGGQGAFEPKDGTGNGFGPKCEQCIGTGHKLQAATEVTFEIPYYEDELFDVRLCGTIDKIGKIQGGCYAIGDYKTTSSADIESFLDDFEMSNQLRFYVLSLKLMAERSPDSMLGKIGATKIGAFIDGIFLKPKVYDNIYRRSYCFQFNDFDLAEYRGQLDLLIHELLCAIKNETWHHKEGLMNGACKAGYFKCDYWLPCKAQNKAVEELILRRDFIQKPYNPLAHND